MQDDFHDTAHDVMFDGREHGCVLLIGHVKKRGVVRNDLVVLQMSDSPKRRFGEKFDDGSLLAVDGVIDLFARENVGKDSLLFAVVVTEVLAYIVEINVELNTHELFDAVVNGGKLVDTGFSVTSPNFAG